MPFIIDRSLFSPHILGEGPVSDNGIQIIKTFDSTNHDSWAVNSFIAYRIKHLLKNEPNVSTQFRVETLENNRISFEFTEPSSPNALRAMLVIWNKVTNGNCPKYDLDCIHIINSVDMSNAVFHETLDKMDPKDWKYATINGQSCIIFSDPSQKVLFQLTKD